MAGAGFKTFTTGEVLLAADVNQYLMQQTVMVFDDASARATAIPSPSEGMFSYLKDTNLTYRYDGSAWLSDAGATSPLTTKGDIWGYSTADARIPVGANGTVLTADSAEALGVKWAAAGGGAGITLITSQALSASTININNVFTSTYENYLLVLNVTNMSLGANIRLRLRASGTDTTTNYGMQLVQTYQSTLNGQESSVTDYWQFGNADPDECFQVIELARPNTADTTWAISHSITGLSGTFNDLLSEWYGGVQKSSTQFDGITIYSHNSATITGTMRIYGRANS